jgi:hypothetical protein
MISKNTFNLAEIPKETEINVRLTEWDFFSFENVKVRFQLLAQIYDLSFLQMKPIVVRRMGSTSMSSKFTYYSVDGMSHRARLFVSGYQLLNWPDYEFESRPQIDKLSTTATVDF